MKGLKPIRTVENLIAYLQRCTPEAEALLMPEEGDGFRIGGVLEFSAQEPKEVWILIDEFGEANGEDWVGDPTTIEDATEVTERPGDMANSAVVDLPPSPERKKADVIQIRGNMRSA